MEIAAIEPTVPDGTVVSRYADITMDGFVALVEANPVVYLTFNAAGDVVTQTIFNDHGIVRSLIATHLCNWLFSGALPGYGAGIGAAFELEGWNSRPDVAVCPLVGNVIPREAPRVAVEVRSDSNTWRELRSKARRYLAQGTQMVWLVDTDGRRVELHRAGASVQMTGSEEVIEGGAALPGFQVAVRDLFPD